MALRITLGQYYPADSAIHALDPRTKVAVALVVMASTFFVRTPSQLAFSWAVALAATWLTRVPLPRVMRSVAPVAAFALMLGVFNLLLVRGGDVLLAVGPLTITSDGVWAALLYPLRLAVAVIAAALLLLTTTPTRLTDAFDAFLSPLSRMGLPGHEIAMVFSLMLRFIPTLASEAAAISDAQMLRGAGLNEGSLAHRVRSVVPIVVALLASAIRHASDLSRALDARCYVGGADRSHWHPLRMERNDWLALTMTLAYLIALLQLP